mmetsp:Transcript_651/g.1932  ORF Transcript_651/g.1932 Transcript_651/m.1932 type:complete len:91 (-) Transcript_651:213-485(-)
MAWMMALAKCLLHSSHPWFLWSSRPILGVLDLDPVLDGNIVNVLLIAVAQRRNYEMILGERLDLMLGKSLEGHSIQRSFILLLAKTHCID